MKEPDHANREAGIGEEPQEISNLLKTLSADIVRVVMVEIRLFGDTLLSMIGLTMLIALLLVGGWLFAGAALALALAELAFFSLPNALLIVGLVHLVLAALMFWRRRHIARDLVFQESRASLNSLLIYARAIGEAVAAEAPGSGFEETGSGETEPEKTRSERTEGNPGESTQGRSDKAGSNL